MNVVNVNSCVISGGFYIPPSWSQSHQQDHLLKSLSSSNIQLWFTSGEAVVADTEFLIILIVLSHSNAITQMSCTNKFHTVLERHKSQLWRLICSQTSWLNALWSVEHGCGGWQILRSNRSHACSKWVTVHCFNLHSTVLSSVSLLPIVLCVFQDSEQYIMINRDAPLSFWYASWLDLKCGGWYEDTLLFILINNITVWL